MSKSKKNFKNKKATVPYSESLGTFIKKSRLAAGLSQKQLAESLGLDNQNISNWERGLAGPSFESYVLLCEILGISERKMLQLLRREQEKLFERELARIKASK